MKFDEMGKQKLVDKSIQPMATIASITPANFTVATHTPAYGAIVLGDYKGSARFLDLNKLVNEPLVWAEQQHILGILDGREEDYDLQTLTITLAEIAGTAHTATFTVPSGEVWYLNRVVGTLPASGGANIITYNWRCNLWTDRAATPSTAGQAFHAADVNFGAGGGTQFDDFGIEAVWWNLTNQQVMLRLPAGTIITCTFTNTGVGAAATVLATCQMYGFIGKSLVA